MLELIVIGLILVWLGPALFWIGVCVLLEYIGKRAREREERERMARKGLLPPLPEPPSPHQITDGPASCGTTENETLDQVIARINARERQISRVEDCERSSGLSCDSQKDGMGLGIHGQMLGVVRCPHVAAWWRNPQAANPCARILRYQRDIGVASSLSESQVPEPWSGRIDQAQILFVGSVPGLAADEHYPRPDWADADIVEFFVHRFDRYVLSGIRHRLRDGGYSRQWTRYWANVKRRAAEVLEREPNPGEDYALTEVVHCKTKGEKSVWEVRDECVARHLLPILNLSAAKLIICLGDHARDALYEVCGQAFDSWPPIPSCWGPVELAGRTRHVAFLPHPNAREQRSFASCLPEAIGELRRILR